MKNKKKTSQFPSIYRIITESKVYKHLKKLEFRLLLQAKHKKYIYYVFIFLTAILSILLIIGILTFSARFYKSASEFTKINTERQSLQKKINFWQSIANKYEGYKDAYFQIAILEYRLGNFKKAEEYNKKALLLDPNFEDSKKLEILLEEE